jgi:hypothetical protein
MNSDASLADLITCALSAHTQRYKIITKEQEQVVRSRLVSKELGRAHTVRLRVPRRWEGALEDAHPPASHRNVVRTDCGEICPFEQWGLGEGETKSVVRTCAQTCE